MRLATVFLVLLLMAQGAAGEEELTPAQRAQLKQANQALVDSQKDATDVFVVQEDGTIKHVQSGLVCAAKYPNVDFWHVEVFDGGKGNDVGCDYGRNGADRQCVEAHDLRRQAGGR